MEQRKLNEILNVIGKREGISSAEVEREIQRAIDSGFDSSDVSVRTEWTKVPYKGERPTVMEVIEYICKEIHKNS